jgi:hypothetical protein
MEGVKEYGLTSPPDSAASPAPSNPSNASRNSTLPAPRVHRLRPGSQKEIALINYLDDKILRITRRYAKKFSNEGRDNDDTPGYTTYDEFATDVEPLVNVVWISSTRKFLCPGHQYLFLTSPILRLWIDHGRDLVAFVIEILPSSQGVRVLTFVPSSNASNSIPPYSRRTGLFISPGFPIFNLVLCPCGEN